MKDASFDRLSAQGLARLLDIEEGDVAWSKEDAAAALMHQLDTPLLPDLLDVPGADPQRMARWTIAGGPLHERTFLQALLDPKASAEALETIKMWAKEIRPRHANPLAGGPATLLYYAAIAASLVHAAKKNSTLSEQQLRDGFSWCLQQRGVDRLRPLFKGALKTAGRVG